MIMLSANRHIYDHTTHNTKHTRIMQHKPHARCQQLIMPALRCSLQAKTEPITLNSTRPSIARQFVQKQLTYQGQGMSAAAAFQQVEMEMSHKLSSLG